VAEKVRNLKDIIEGHSDTWEVSEVERSEMLATEHELGTRLETVFNITPTSVAFNCNYLLTEAGMADFTTVTGISIPETVQTNNELKTFLYSQTEELLAVDQKELKPLAGRSSSYHETQVLESLAASMDGTGAITTEHIPSSDSISFRLSPELDGQKTKQLRELKTEIKQRRAGLQSSEKPEDYQAMLDGIYSLYQRRINELIADRASAFVSLRRKAEFGGEDSLTAAETQALNQDFGSANIETTLARYDKFITGASPDSTPEGWKKQVSTELTELADQQEIAFIDNLLHQREAIAKKGLSQEKIFSLDIPVEEVRKCAEETLAHYGILSEVPVEEYSPKRPGPAADNKWQIIIKDSYKSMSVNGKQKVIKIPNKPQSAERLLGVSLAHEIEGHGLQHTNRANIPLKLFETVGSDRSGIFAEAGAISNEDHLKHIAFGYRKVTHPHYIRAMTKKLEGGDYNDCLNAYYESAIKGYRLLLEQDTIDESTFRSECLKQLEEAINRTGRLFRGGASKEAESGHIAESKATVYLEQTKLATELKAQELDKALNLTGVNLDALEFLLRAKLIDLESLKTPDFYSLTLWERMKDKYSAE